jgi:hypothetical protein
VTHGFGNAFGGLTVRGIVEHALHLRGELSHIHPPKIAMPPAIQAVLSSGMAEDSRFQRNFC